VVFDSHDRWKDVKADFAVRGSMSIPIFFKSVKHENQRLVDGGVLNNFPVRKFREHLDTDDFIALYLGAVREPVRNSRWLLSDLLSLWLGQDERAILDQFSAQTVVIDPHPIRTTDFVLTDAEKEYLVLAGRAAALQFLVRRTPGNTTLRDEANEAATDAKARQKEILQQRSMRRQRTRWRRLMLVAIVAALLAGYLAWRRPVSGSPSGPVISYDLAPNLSFQAAVVMLSTPQQLTPRFIGCDASLLKARVREGPIEGDIISVISQLPYRLEGGPTTQKLEVTRAEHNFLDIRCR
jgi:hypothetical protein